MTRERRPGVLVCSLFVAGCSQILGLDLEGYHPRLPQQDAGRDASEDAGGDGPEDAGGSSPESGRADGPESEEMDARGDLGATEGPSGDVAGRPDAGSPDASDVADAPEDHSSRDASLQDAPMRDAVADGDAPPPAIGAHLWSKRFGSKLGDVATGIATDPSGNVFLTGVFEGVVDFGGGPLSKVAPDSGIEPGQDFMLAKFDSMGRHVWSRRFAALYSSGVAKVSVDPSGNVLLAGTSDDTLDLGGGLVAGPPADATGGNPAGILFVAKYDPAGNHVWSKGFGRGAGQTFGAVAVDGAGNVFLTGTFRGTIDFGGGPMTSLGTTSGADIYLAEFDASGRHKWSKHFGAITSQTVRSLAVDPDGNVIIGGNFEGTLDFGTGAHDAKGYTDGYVAKFSPLGDSVWTRVFGGISSDETLAVASDPSGNVVFGGRFGGVIDLGGGPLADAGNPRDSNSVLIAKFGPDGNHLWSKGAPSASGVTISVACDTFGNVLATGDAIDDPLDLGGGPLAPLGGADIFVVKFSPPGGHLWSKRWGDANDQSPETMAVDPANNVLLAGGFYGKVDFGGGPLSSAGSNDMFVAKFIP